MNPSLSILPAARCWFSFHFAGSLRAKLLRGLIRHRNTGVVIAASVLTLMLTLHLLAPVAVPNLAQPVNAARALDVAQEWAKGNVIALVRHAERCDRSSLPCLGPLDGITVLAFWRTVLASTHSQGVERYALKVAIQPTGIPILTHAAHSLLVLITLSANANRPIRAGLVNT